MPICITCSTPVRNLYTTYSKADDRSLGKGVRLTQCPNCKRFADKYVEHDYVVLFIDLVLIKPQVYRHLLFNRLWNPHDALDPSILRLGILLILFDVYITWARIEKLNSSSTDSNTSNFSDAPIITQYLFFLTLNVAATVTQHVVIRGLARLLVKPSASTTNMARPPGGTDEMEFVASPTAIAHSRSNSSPSKLPSTKTTTSRNASLNPNRKLSRNKRSPSPNYSSPVSAAVDITSPSTSSSISAATPTSSSATPISTLTPTASTPSELRSISTTALDDPTTKTTTTTAAAASTSVQPQPDPKPQTTITQSNRPTPPPPSAISTALLVSSCTKLFPILLVIWPTTSSSSGDDDHHTTASTSMSPFTHRATSYIGWIVLLNNIEALLILMDCGYVVAGLLAVAGSICRWLVEGWLLGLVGLVRDGDGEGPVGDVIELLRWAFSLR